MRKLCLILCLGILTSLFHAAVMSVETLPAQTQPAFKCALGAHLCCLGLTAAFVDSPVFVFTGHNALINPVVLSLTLQTRANKLFKPPKRALLA